MGHESSIATVTNMFPELVQNIMSAVSTGDVNTARKLQETLNRAVDNITEQGLPFVHIISIIPLSIFCSCLFKWVRERTNFTVVSAVD